MEQHSMQIKKAEPANPRRATLSSLVRFWWHYAYFYLATFWRLANITLRGRISRFLSSDPSARLGKELTGFQLVLALPFIMVRACGTIVRKAILRPLTRLVNKIHYIHINISSRALNALLDTCSDQNAAAFLCELERQIGKGTAQPHVLRNAVFLAIKLDEIDAARRFADQLVREHADAFGEHQQAGIRFFLAGHYDDAERIWGESAEHRARALEQEGLDRLNMRLLGSSWLLAIGHIAHIDIYLKHKILSGHGSQRTIISQPRHATVPNQPLLNCWNQHVEIYQPDWQPGLTLRQIEILQDEFWSLRFAPGDTRMFSHAGARVQREWDRQGRGPLLTLPADLEEFGWSCMEKLGVPRGRWFVCLHVREPGFHRAWHEKHPGTRNADVSTYMQAAHRVIAQGGYVIRVGDATMKKLPAHEGLIDYAHAAEKSDEMDIFLCAKARFFIGTNSGLGLVPPIFGVPCAMTNWTPIALPQWYGADRFIPKVIWSAQLGRALTLTELFESPAAWQQFQHYFDTSALEVRDNTPDEIEELIVEMLEETAGQKVLTAEDEVLVQGYNRLAIRNGSYVGARLGRAWLRRHAAELSDLAAAPDSGEIPVATGAGHAGR